MKSNLNNIILNFVIILFLGSCHTIEHQNILLDTKKRNENHDKKIENSEKKDTEIKIRDFDENKPLNSVEMAPIKVPQKKHKVLVGEYADLFLWKNLEQNPEHFSEYFSGSFLGNFSGNFPGHLRGRLTEQRLAYQAPVPGTLNPGPGP